MDNYASQTNRVLIRCVFIRRQAQLLRSGLSRICLLLCAFLLVSACTYPVGVQTFQQPQNLQSQYRQLSQDWLADLQRRGLIYRDARAEQIIEPVMQRLVPNYSRLGIDIQLARLPGENAIALPDGTLVIHQSMLAALASEEQLAFLLAHEISHHLLNHAWYSAKYYSDQAAMVGSFRSSNTKPAGSFSRNQEQQADDYAVKLMHRAGYDVNKAAGFFEQLRRYPMQFTGSGDSRTHPSLLQRQLYLSRVSQQSTNSRLTYYNSVSPDYYHRFRLGQLIASIEHKVNESDLPGALVQLSELESIQGRTALGDCLRADVYQAIGDDMVAASQAFSEISGKRERSSSVTVAQQFFMQKADAVLREGLMRFPDAGCIRDRM